MSRPGSPLGSPPPGTRRRAGDLTERRQAARNAVPPARSKPPRFTPTVHEMTILRVRLFGFRFTDVLRDIDEGSARRAHGPKRGRSRLPGHGLDAGDGELFGCPTWTAIGDWAADAGRCGAWASWSTTPSCEPDARTSEVKELHGMRSVRSFVVAVLAVVVLAVPAVVLADGRVSLVVGNSTYAHIGRLPNPDNDAADMSAALRRLGFEVTTELDADRVELTEALRAFTRRSAGADVSLVFYAGHGIEMDGVNYLVPVDARLERDVDVRFETVTVDDLLVSTSGASLRLVLLDACRNNPLARSMQRTAATRTVSGGSFADLNEDLLGDETLVAYAASAGTTAADGRGRNSPYTAALLSHLETPLEIGLLFRRVGGTPPTNH